jgi:hypothetical protein
MRSGITSRRICDEFLRLGNSGMPPGSASPESRDSLTVPAREGGMIADSSDPRSGLRMLPHPSLWRPAGRLGARGQPPCLAAWGTAPGREDSPPTSAFFQPQGRVPGAVTGGLDGPERTNPALQGDLPTILPVTTGCKLKAVGRRAVPDRLRGAWT